MTLCLWGPLLCYCHNINMGAVWMLYAAFDQKDMVEIIFFSLTERSKERSFQDLGIFRYCLFCKNWKFIVKSTVNKCKKLVKIVQ